MYENRFVYNGQEVGGKEVRAIISGMEGQLPATEVAGLSMTGLRLTLALNVLVD